MKKLSVCILFGGISPEHAVSLRSAESVLNNIDKEKYNVFPVGITREGDWIHFGGTDYSMLPSGEWINHPDNRRATISPIRGQGLLRFEGDCVVRERIDVVFPVLHGENGEDGAMQGLLQMAGIAYVGPHVAASAVSMDKTLTKLVVDNAQVPQAAWQLVRASELHHRMDGVLNMLEQKFEYPMFVKPAGTGSSVGVSKAAGRDDLREALLNAGEYDAEYAKAGARECAVSGLGRAAFAGRILNTLGGKDKAKIQSYLLGAVLALDVQAMQSFIGDQENVEAFVAGKAPLQQCFCDVIEALAAGEAVQVPVELSGKMGLAGVLEIAL